MAAMALRADVVVVRDQRQSIFFVGNRAVGIKQAGLMLIDQVLDPSKVLKLPRIGCIAIHRLHRVSKVGRQVLVAVIEIGVLRIISVVRNSGIWAKEDEIGKSIR